MSIGAVGRPGAVVSAVNVGGSGASVLGKYPPPIETTEPCLEVSGCDIGDTSLCDDWVYPVGAEGRLGGGGDTWRAEKLGDGWVEVFGAVSTDGWYGFGGGAPWFIRWTSGSFGSNADGDMGCCGVSCTGFVALGSSLALIALTMRSAWYLANFVLEVISGSLFFHIDMISRKVDAARRVSAVCLGGC